MRFVWVILAGFVVGIIAKMLTPGSDPRGCLITAGIGIAGSLIATMLGEALDFYRPGERAGFIGSVIGAILLLLAYRAVRGKTP